MGDGRGVAGKSAAGQRKAGGNPGENRGEKSDGKGRGFFVIFPGEMRKIKVSIPLEKS